MSKEVVIRQDLGDEFDVGTITAGKLRVDATKIANLDQAVNEPTVSGVIKELIQDEIDDIKAEDINNLGQSVVDAIVADNGLQETLAESLEDNIASVEGLPSGGVVGQYATPDGMGGYVWQTPSTFSDTNTTYSNNGGDLVIKASDGNDIDLTSPVQNAIDSKIPTGSEGQVLSFDASGNLVNADAPSGLPSGGNEGQYVTLDASGNQIWADLPDLETDPTIDDSICPQDLTTLTPSSVGQKITICNGVTYIANSTTVGDWSVYYNRDTFLFNGKDDRQGQFYNGSRSKNNTGVIAISKGRPYVFGQNPVEGALPVGDSYICESITVRAIFKQHPTRPHPDFDEFKVGTVDPIVYAKQGEFEAGHFLSESGIVYAWHIQNSEVSHISGVDGLNIRNSTAVPVFFDDGGANRPISFFELDVSFTTYHVGGLYVGSDGSVWVMSSNPENLKMDVNMPDGGTQQPTKIVKTEWSGLTPVKMRVQDGRNFVILFDNGQLWACGRNENGQFGLGDNNKRENFVLIASSVSDFEMSETGDTNNDSLYYIDNSGELFGAGEGGSGTFNQNNRNDSNTFVSIDTNVDRAILGGGDVKQCLAYTKSGQWYRLGKNDRGIFGNSSTVDVLSSELWTELNQLVSQNGDIVDLTFNYKYGNLWLCSVIFKNGTLFHSGHGEAGQKGDGTYSSSTVFSQSRHVLEYGEVPNELHIGTSSDDINEPYVYFSTNFNNVYTCGENDYNSLGNPTFSSINFNQSIYSKLILPQ